ncbi:AI-2E family transporter [Haloarcula onubensis]|uniref:AI-2E family transporter n=1 Tax=Haloarcula onubensis TaxID=2950539 RepID=A0ABU2FKN4_9EURY|nr:AI-2E family transporter [Halomicroarcula sp. S3CR25-11]MDS0280984.1 AI-2E family transporter [Halomicroarcula sp. S3CR25-11]
MDHESTVRDSLRDPGVAWWLVGIAVLGVLAWVGVSYLGWLVFGLFTYYVARPIARRVQSRVGSPTLAAGITLAFIIVPIVLFIAAFLSVAVGQALQLLGGQPAQQLLARLPLPTQTLPTDPVQVAVVLVQDPTVSTALGQFGVAVGAAGATLFNVFLALIFAFFLLTSGDALADWFRANVLGADSLAVEYLRRVDDGLTSVYFGYTLTIFVVIVLAAIIYTVFNAVAPGDLTIPQAVLLAVVTGIFTLIPLLGRSIVYAFIVALLAVQALAVDATLLWVPVAFFAVMVLVFDNVIRTYVRPYLSGKAYHMALVMFAYLLGPALFGWYGIFMGPLVMVVTVEFITDILPRLSGVAPGGADETAVEEAAEPPVEGTDTADRGGETPSD